MNNNNLSPYFITYNNHFYFNGRLLAFRKKELFDITETPKYIKFIGYWNVNKVQLSVEKAKSLVKKEPKIIDVSNLQWHRQSELDKVFNL